MGLDILFDTQCDLSGISNKELYVSQFDHKAYINVNEKGKFKKNNSLPVAKTSHLCPRKESKQRLKNILPKAFCETSIKGRIASKRKNCSE